MGIERVAEILFANDAALLAVFLTHILWCARRERQRGKMVEFLKIKLGYEE